MWAMIEKLRRRSWGMATRRECSRADRESSGGSGGGPHAIARHGLAQVPIMGAKAA